MKVVFIDAYPRRNADVPSLIPLPSNTSSWKQLCDYVNMPVEQFNRDFRRAYLLPVQPQDEFTPAQGKPYALNLLPLLQGRRVVLLGKPVAEAFGLQPEDYSYFEFFEHPDWVQSNADWSVIPHPLHPIYRDYGSSIVELQQFMSYVQQIHLVPQMTET